MFYENDLKLKKMKYSSINYANFSNGLNSDTDEGLLPIKFSPNTYNFNYSFGALTTGLGVGEAEFVFDIEDKSKKKKFIMPDDVDILGCWIYNYFNYYINQYYDILVVYASDKKMYYGFLYESIKTMFRMGSFTFDECPILINYNYNNQDVVLVCDKTKMYLWNYNTGTVTIANPPKIASMSMHYDKIFATMADDKKSIYYSQDFNPKAWNVALTQGSVINLLDDKGTLNKVVSFDDNLFVFREFGIAKLSIYSNMDKFNVVQVFTSGNRIFENTVTVCGDKIIFLASDGLYSFNGNTTSKLDINIDNILLKNNTTRQWHLFIMDAIIWRAKLSLVMTKKLCAKTTIL